MRVFPWDQKCVVCQEDSWPEAVFLSDNETPTCNRECDRLISNWFWCKEIYLDGDDDFGKIKWKNFVANYWVFVWSFPHKCIFRFGINIFVHHFSLWMFSLSRNIGNLICVLPYTDIHFHFLSFISFSLRLFYQFIHFNIIIILQHIFYHKNKMRIKKLLTNCSIIHWWVEMWGWGCVCVWFCMF